MSTLLHTGIITCGKDFSMNKLILLAKCGISLLLLYLIGVVPLTQGITARANMLNNGKDPFTNASCTLIPGGKVKLNLDGSNISLSVKRQLNGFGLSCQSSANSNSGFKPVVNPANPTDRKNKLHVTGSTRIDPSVKVKNCTGFTDSKVSVNTGEGKFTYHQITIAPQSDINCANITYQFSKDAAASSQLCDFNYYEAPGGSKWTLAFTFANNPDPAASPEALSSNGPGWKTNTLSQVESAKVGFDNSGGGIDLTNGGIILVGPYFVNCQAG